jgi:hypothetical protein
MSRPTVAVVAVHGVADQAAGSSAHAIAGLLLQSGEGRNYTPAHEVTLHIPVARAEVPSAGPPTPAPRRTTLFDDEGDPPAPGLSRAGGHAPVAAPDHQLMRRQLRWYRGGRQPYETVRLETQRLDETGRPAVDVHVYEMYWADLSRLGEGFLRFFSELYQLLFHSANLGRQTLDHAFLEHGDDWRWRRLGEVQKWAVRILTIFIPAIALVILTIGSTPFALLPPRGWQTPLAIAFAGAALALLFAHQQYRKGAPASFATWTLIRVGTLVLAAAILRFLLGLGETPLLGLLISEWMILGFLLLFMVLRIYDRHRPGALAIGMGMYLLAIVAFLGLLARDVPTGLDTGGLGFVAARTTRAVLWTVEGLYLGGMLAWVVLFGLGAFSWLLGGRTVRSARKAAAGAGPSGEAAAIADRAARAVRTARLTLALPAAAFIVVTTMLWYVVVRAAEAMLERSTLPGILQLQHCPLAGGPCIAVGELLDKLLEGISGLGLPLAGLLLAVGLGLLGWWLVPVAVAEVRPPDPEQADSPDLSERMGVWLSRGFAYALAWISALIAIAVVVGVAAFLASFLIDWSGAPTEGVLARLRPIIVPAAQVAGATVELLGGFLVAGAVGVLALRRGRLEALSRAVRPVLDVILDVDGYLREHPRDRTSRARIAERYVSLLRYLCAWRNPADPDRPYEAIVIVAHSQGTVITTDLLGFLRRERDPALDPITRDDAGPGAVTIPVCLFTMGSPLRQLYQEFFPHLYSWVKRRPAAWQHVDLVPPDALAPPGPSAETFAPNPDPSGLRVTRWVNAYRAGDYVGRYLWLDDEDRDRFRPGRRHDALTRRWEVCVGAGAHTHYWDSGEIAKVLDSLVRV